ncbi:alpha/beta hydrolase family protein [Nocardia sp. CDC160]|uniref:alpha/beta hydrolase family protein n=1 Tax=Nocardia sp. CDC160 TaxID=3112166 RepID=UPI002DBEC6D7|nr:alpha/beta fold hydrolase [Nocardia sp. CDC160]MEC3920008.1 alpha/beta fold hydrolase [Nocardia sp. CDC160]
MASNAWTEEGISVLDRGFRLLLIVLLCSACAVFGVAGRAEPVAAQQESSLITLPEATGSESIGVVDLHLVDASRLDPYVPARARELMVSIWYPAADSAAIPLRPWVSEQMWRVYTDGLAKAGLPIVGSLPLGSSHGHVDAAANSAAGRRPIVLFSPGMGLPRETSTAQAEDLASHGFVVVTMSHTYESMATEFPGGRLEKSVLLPGADADEVNAQIGQAIQTRVADTRFILDRLTDISAGIDPDADGHPLPANLAGILDLSKIAMFGHSLGGATAAQVMHDDRRVAAGVDLDGTLMGSVLTDGLDRPFVLIGSTDHGRAQDPSWQQFWANDRGPKMELRLDGSQHLSFCDNQAIVPALTAAGIMPADFAAKVVGTIAPQDSLDLQRAYLRTFFDTTFGRYEDLTNAAATILLHPEMIAIP